MKTKNLIGLDSENAQQVVNLLNELLANYQIYYQNLRGFHWNVRGNRFFVLHAKFEELYNDAIEKVDEIAERIMRYDEVKAVYLMSGGFDFTVIIEEKTMKEISQFVTSKLSTLDSILSTSTNFVLKKYKDYGTIFGKKSKDERIQMIP